MKADGKVAENFGSIGMVRVTKCQCSSMELDGLIEVRLDTPMPESVSKADGKVIERLGSMRIVRKTERQCSSMELNGLLQV